MAVSERIYRVTDKPMSWTRAIVLGLVIWFIAIMLLGQLPSWIIYRFDQDVATIIGWTTWLPGIGSICSALGSGQPAGEGCNPTQIAIVRDIVANTVQIGILVGMLAFAYIWQERKRKRVGGKGVQDVVKGYMPGK